MFDLAEFYYIISFMLFFALAVLIFFVAFFIGFLFVHFKDGNLKARLENEKDKRVQLDQENQTYKQKELELEKELSRLETQKAQFKNQLEDQKIYYEEKLKNKDEKIKEREQFFEEKLREQKLVFENLANKIFSENTKSYREETTKNLGHILKPFREDIEAFKKSVQGFETKGGVVDETLKELRSMHKQLSQETASLAQALKGESNKQGQWGEFILENILEKSGLRKEEEFFTQFDLKDKKGGSFRADVVVKLPDEKYIVIDSKTSSKHYFEYCSLSDSEEKKQVLKQLLKSIESQVNDLSSKGYHLLSTGQKEHIKTPDFTLMFIPHEGVFSLVTQEGELFEKAWNKQVVLVSPTTLYATLKTIASIWKIEKQNRNVRDIAIESGRMYDKFCNFMKDMKDIDKGIKQIQGSYDSAFIKLRGKGSLISKAEKIKQLGANAKKDLKDQLDKEDLEVLPIPKQTDKTYKINP